jgi:hypothetical protein
MDKRIQQGMEWLNKEIEKDKVEIENHKKKTIEEILKLDKTKMFQPPPKKKTSFFNKLFKILGYGKKG